MRVGRAEAEPEGRRPVEGRARALGDETEAHAHRQQVLDGDRALRGNGVAGGIARRDVEAPEHPAIGELGQQAVDGLVERERPVGDELHRQRRDQGLRVRAEPDHRVGTQRGVPAGVGAADRREARPTAVADPDDRAGHEARLDGPAHTLDHVVGVHGRPRGSVSSISSARAEPAGRRRHPADRHRSRGPRGRRGAARRGPRSAAPARRAPTPRRRVPRPAGRGQVELLRPHEGPQSAPTAVAQRYVVHDSIVSR